LREGCFVGGCSIIGLVWEKAIRDEGLGYEFVMFWMQMVSEVMINYV
jgi:hypothetical protein